MKDTIDLIKRNMFIPPTEEEWREQDRKNHIRDWWIFCFAPIIVILTALFTFIFISFSLPH